MCTCFDDAINNLFANMFDEIKPNTTGNNKGKPKKEKNYIDLHRLYVFCNHAASN